jgi:hypothetical protein
MIFSLVKPEVEAMKNSYREKDCASNQESPHGLCKAGKNVREPCNETRYTNK